MIIVVTGLYFVGPEILGKKHLDSTFPPDQSFFSATSEGCGFGGIPTRRWEEAGKKQKLAQSKVI